MSRSNIVLRTYFEIIGGEGALVPTVDESIFQVI